LNSAVHKELPSDESPTRFSMDCAMNLLLGQWLPTRAVRSPWGC